MSRRIVQNIIMVAVAFGLGIAVGTLGLLWATGGNATPSRDTSEVVSQLSLDDPTPVPAVDLATELDAINAKLDNLLEQSMMTEPEAAAGTDDDAASEAAGEDAEALTADRVLFTITEDESEARFLIEEELLGSPTTVVGTTRRVAGDLIVNFTDPSASQLGDIAVNARTLRTDNEFRDQSIRGQILEASQAEFEFIIFAPTALQNLPDSAVAVGDTLEFQILGDLTIRGVTNEVLFDAAVTVAAADRLEGLATTEVAYADFGLSINPPPNVAGIGDIVTLELDFVALEKQE